MSKPLIKLLMFPTKFVINAYTWTTLPFYTIIQRPWYRLKLSKSFGVHQTKDPQGRIIYSRKSPIDFHHPYSKCTSFNEMVPLLDRSRKVLGIRPILQESIQIDPKTGEPIKLDGKEFKKIKLSNDYHWYTVGEVMARVDSLARGLKKMGVAEGEKVIIYAENSLDWFCTALALLRLNAVTVTLLAILNKESVLYGINQSEARFIITSEQLLPRIQRISHHFSHLTNIIYIPKQNHSQSNSITSVKSSFHQNLQITTLTEILDSGSRTPPYPFTHPNPESICLIVYTSGTTGNPKGVMITHRNMVESILNLFRFENETQIPFFRNSTYASYLPMTHLFGYRMNLGSFLSDNSRFALCNPATMFDHSPSHITGQSGDFRLIKPRFIPAVPLILERILKEIYKNLNEFSPLAKPLFDYLMDYKIRWTGRGYDTPLINQFVSRNLNRKYFGGNLEMIYVSSAPLSTRTQALVKAALNVNLIQSYGATELTAGTHLMLPEDLSFGECGVPLNSVKYYLKDWEDGDYSTKDKPNPRGEIVVGGDTVSMGYYKMALESDESFKVDDKGERWFETGDIGEVLPNGTLKIIDRKKDLTKLANGEFVSLGKIESGLRSCPLVENICICADPYSNYVTALVSPNRQTLQEYSIKTNKSNLTFEQLCTDPELIQAVQESIQIKSRELGFSPKEIPTRIMLVPDEWTPDNNLLTAALKLRRKQVNVFYAEQIRQMFVGESREL